MLLLRRRRLAFLGLLTLLALVAIAIAAQYLPPMWTIGSHVLTAIAAGAWGWAIWRGLVASEQRQRVILEISHEMARKVEVGDLLDYVVQASLSLVPLADKCVIHLLDEHGRRLYPRYSSRPDWHQQVGLPASKGIAGQALRERATIVIDDVRENEQFLPLASTSELRALLVAPLRIHETVLGTISLNSSTPGAFSDHDKSLMTIVATQLSSALQQSLLYEQAQLQQRYVESLLLHLPCGVALLDDRMRLVHYNAAFAHILGADPSQIVGRVASHDSAESSLRLLASMIEQEGEPCNGARTCKLDVDAPTRANLWATVAEITTLTGREQIIVMVLDETAHQTKVDDIASLLDVAHREMVPSLEAIRGYAALLGGALAKDPGTRKWANEIQTKSGDLANRARDLAFLRAQYTDTMTSHPESLDLVGTMAEWRSLLGPQAQARGVALVITLDTPDTPWATVDADKLDHAVRNLLSGAISRGYRGGQITLSAAVSPHDLVITIQDNGRALSAEDHQCIVEGHARWDDQDARTPSGTALALHVSRRLIQAMGGHLWIEQDANLGVLAHIILPL